MPGLFSSTFWARPQGSFAGVASRIPGRGITLIEIMMALFILAATMIPVASIMGVGSKATQKDSRRIVAIQTMQNQANLLLQAPFKDIPLGTELTSYSTAPVKLGTIVGPNQVSYQVKLTCSALSPVSLGYYSVNVQNAGFQEGNPQPTDFVGPRTLFLSNCVKRLKILVTWKETGGRDVEISCLTYRADLNRRGSS